MRPVRASLLAAVLVVATAGCTDAGPDATTDATNSSDSATASSTVELQCDTAIDTDADLPDSYTAIADVVALPTADSAERALQTSHREDAPSPNYFAKTGLLVRADAAVTIEIDGPSMTAQLGWGSPMDAASTITTDGCPGTGWLAFAGGFLVDQPRCVEVTVRTDGAEVTAQVGVGAPCAGQLPPPEPTDP